MHIISGPSQRWPESSKSVRSSKLPQPGGPTMSQSNLETKLQDALNRFKWSEVENMCKDTVKLIRTHSTSIDADSAKRLLAMLRRKRQFGCMMLLAETFIRSDVDTFPVRRHYAQALI